MTENDNADLSAKAMSVIGKLADSDGGGLLLHYDHIVPLAIAMLQDHSSGNKRLAALITLRKIFNNNCVAISPLLQFSNLLDILLTLLKIEDCTIIRMASLNLIGILGALDPYKHSLLSLPKTKTKEVVLPEVHNSFDEEYYPFVAVSSLLKILNDSSLAIHHSAAIQCLMYMFESLGVLYVLYLPEVVPAFVNILRSCPLHMIEFYLINLTSLVAIFKAHMDIYAKDIIHLVAVIWESNINLDIALLSVVEALSSALEERIADFLPQLMVFICKILERDPDLASFAIQKALRVVTKFGVIISDYLPLILPIFLVLLHKSITQTAIQKVVVESIGNLATYCKMNAFASEVIQSLLREFKSTHSEELQASILDIIVVFAFHLNQEFLPYVSFANKVLLESRFKDHKLSQVISLIVCQKSIPIDYLVKSNHTIDAPKIDLTIQKVFVNQQRLRESWDTSEKSTSEDWAEWMRRLNIELLKETSSHSLRSCSALAAVYNPLARDLFHAAFVSCWKDLDHVGRADLVKALETVLNSATTTPEITQILLNLIEFMELDDNPLPLDIRNLSGYASKCRAWSKALRWKELEFLQTPNATTTESLISINSQLQQYDAAVGILQFIQESGAHLQPAPLWYEKLNRWEDALNAYQHCLLPESAAKLIGQMRCLQHLGEWDQLSYLAKQNWERVGSEARQAIASLAAVSSWTLSDWQFMEQCVGALKEESPDCAFFRAVLAINDGDFPEASRLIEVSRKLLDTELIVLLSESYRRAYHVVVRFQMLTELDEIITLKSLPNGHDKKAKNMCSWSTRLNLCEPSIEVWQRLLRVRSLAANTKSDSEWIKFANLCRKQGNFRLADGTLSRLLLIPKDENGALDVSRNPPSVVYACLKHTWASNGKEGKERAFEEMRQFTMNIIDRLGIESLSEMASLKDSNTEDSEMQMLFKLLARCYLKLGEWQTELEEDLDPPSLIQILKSFSVAKKCDSTWYKAWHRWASANFEALSFYENRPAQEDNTLLSHAIASVEGFSQAITLSSNSLQDTLRLLTVWFKYGGRVQVASTVSRLFDSISIETWLQVVPQLIARIHTPNRRIQELLLELLGRVGHAHPQAVLWSLTVATKSPNIVRANAALSILNAMRLHSPLLVEQALAVSRELVRIAVPWQEAWNEGLVEASQLYFEERNIEGMFDVLEPLHQMIDGERETTAELDFISKFGYDLSKAWDGCKSFIQTRRVADLELAWDYYRRVFREIRNQLHGISSVQLQQVSPSLINYKGLELAMPGTYKSGEPIVRIETFSEHLSVFATKQRPRKLSINGSNGVEYQFLLKGNEDLRQDERVMQLMQLINTLLLRDSETFKRRLSIERYAVVPLSPNSGLIGWVPNCDTIHGFITDHRKSRNIKEDLEYRLMLNLSPNYDNLPLLHKVDVFQQALAQTSGQDLSRVLWQKSRNSEQWLERRNVFGQSLAVMSMVGYVMGLGDRHPKNLMMEKTTGKVVHIDFGDCFEVAMLRNQFPEKVPFRLTRIFVKALGVTGIEGNFRVTSEHVMRVLRNNRDSLMAVLEAFVYDPLVNWRMLNPTASESPPLEDSRVETPEVLNEHAVSVIARVSKKLAGKDFNTRCPLDIPAQVQRLIEEATSLENLCQGFIGWCPFW
ncbi:hypothetical protein BC830DRAFT_1151012 [Chytriomyces sp. MP71]|nr:hypothetical protein BC830DRAFT_1151012 [Chytriomyces sp. MP71]